MISTAVSLNWIYLKIISGAAFHIIGLTKNPNIEFLPLEWIYCSIRIMMVSTMYEMQTQFGQLEEGHINESLLYECMNLLENLFTIMTSHVGVVTKPLTV